MSVIKIEGGATLKGKVKCSGAKNSILALLPATILSDEPVTIKGYPKIKDVEIVCNILESLGATITKTDDEITVNPINIKNEPLLNENVKKLRASYYFIGAMLARFGNVTTLFPGGCDLGPRPIDMHLNGFKKIGAKVSEKNDTIVIKSKKLNGEKFYFPKVSVGATINMILVSAKSNGITLLENVANEPEVIDLIEMLNNMGAKICFLEERVLSIEGVSSLRGTNHEMIPDRIEAGTYLAIAAACGDGVVIENIRTDHLKSVIKTLRSAGVNLKVREKENSILISKSQKISPVNIETQPYPGFPTDLQQPFLTLFTKAEGLSTITETVFQSRFKHVPELQKMGANINVIDDVAYIRGSVELEGREVVVSDLRAGASLIIAGLIAKGTTVLINTTHIFRGYANIIENLNGLGAKISVEKNILNKNEA